MVYAYTLGLFRHVDLQTSCSCHYCSHYIMKVFKDMTDLAHKGASVSCLDTSAYLFLL